MGRRRAVHRVDLNTASDIQLRTLSGVGPARAQAIIKARKLKGSFACIRDITRVPGICASILDLNRSRLQCSRTRKKKLPITSTLTTEEQPCTRETRRSTRAREVAATIVAQLEMDDGNIRSDVEPSTSQTAHKSRVHLRIDDHVDVPASGDTPSPSATATPARLEPKDQVVTRSFSKSHHGSDDDNDDDDDDDDEVVAAGDSSSDGGGGEDDDADSTENSEVVGSDSESTENVGSVESFPGGASPGSPEGRETRSSKVMKRKSSVAISAHDVSPAKTKRKMLDLSIEDAQALSALTPGGRERRRSCSALSQLGLSPAVLHQEPAMDHHQTFGLPTGATSAHLTPRRRIPSRQNPPVEMADWLKVFQTWSNAERLLALDQLIELCEPTQVRHIMTVIEPQFQRDFISLLPKELALYVLSFLDPRDLLRAAQTCRYWRILAEDNLLWREKCREASIDEAVVLNKKRRPVPGPHKSQWKSAYMRQHQIEMNWRVGTIRPFKMLKGHDDHVITCLQFCGNRVVSGSDDNTLKVWSATTGKCLRTLVGHTGGVWSSQMYGNIIISGSTDRTLKVWNADTGQCIHTLYGHTSTVRCMHLHGSKVVSGSRDATLRVWDVESGECLHVLMGHVAAVRCVQYDGKRVVSGAYDYTVKVWNPETEECLHTLQGHTNRVYSLQFDGVHVVSGSLDTSIRVWEVETGNCLHTLMGHQSLTSGMELKDNTLVSGNADSTVKVWNIETGQCLQTLTGPHKHQSAVTCLQFNSKFVITSSDDGTVKLWDLKTGEFIRNLVALDSGGSGGVVWRIRANQTKLVCAVGSRNGTEETKLLVLDFDAEVK